MLLIIFEKNKVHAIGFDMFENKDTCKTINLYTYQETAEDISIKTYGYSMNLKIMILNLHQIL